MATREELYTALRNADKAGDNAGAKRLAQYIQSMPPDAPVASSDKIPLPVGAAQRMAAEPASAQEDNLLGKIVGVAEAPMALASGTLGGMAGSIAGAVRGLTGGKLGTQQGVQEADKFGGQVADALTYRPRTQTGNKLTQLAGEAMNNSGIMGIPIPELNTLGRAVSSGAGVVRGLANASADAMAAQDAAQAAGGGKLRDLLVSPKPAMAGGGAASTADALMRTQRAADLPVPIQLTKGQASRSFEQQRFERETAKMPEGEPIRQRVADQNQQFLQNFDAFSDETGAQASGLRATGKVVTDALVNKVAKAKEQINAAYNAARSAGAMTEPVPTQGLLDYVEKNRPAALNAPILNSVEQAIRKLDPEGTGMISINDMEELRKMTGNLAQPGTPNSVYGGQVKSLIDAATEGKGGPEYQQARRLYENYANEFKNKAVIDKMLRLKPGTIDRAVAYEDIFNHSIMDGSLDDVRAVRRTLQTAGPEGEQAWKELQGQTVNQIKEAITGNSARDIRGNSIVSPDKLNRMMARLDSDGKLDFIFGKQGAQKLRDMNDIAKDVYTAPPGSVNSSNTASALMRALDATNSIASKVPVIGGAVEYGVKRVKSNMLQKKVNEALNNK